MTVEFPEEQNQVPSFIQLAPNHHLPLTAVNHFLYLPDQLSLLSLDIANP